MSDVAARNVLTPRLGLNQPDVGDDVDGWGDLLNANATILDQALLATGGTMTGALVLAADGAANLQPVSLQQLNAALVLKASLASPAFTGVPTAPTAAPGTNTTQLATTAFVAAAISGSVAGVSSFNTRTGVVSLLAADIAGAGGALLASPAFTGAPTVPTAAPGTNTTQIASTAFVGAALPLPSSTAPAMNGTAAVGVSATWARADHVHPSDTTRLPLAGGVLTGSLGLGNIPLPGSSTPGQLYAVELVSLGGLAFNAYLDADGSTWRYKTNGGALCFAPFGGGTLWMLTAPTGTAGGAITWTHNLELTPDGGVTFGGAATLAANPTAALGAATKQYVDAAVTSRLPLTGGSLSGPLIIADPAGTQLTLNAPVNTQVRVVFQAAGMTGWSVGVDSSGEFNVFDITSGNSLWLVGTGRKQTWFATDGSTLVLDGTGLTLPHPPTVAMHAATKQYVDGFLPLAGGTLTGQLNGTTISLSGALTVGGAGIAYPWGANQFGFGWTGHQPQIYVNNAAPFPFPITSDCSAISTIGGTAGPTSISIQFTSGDATANRLCYVDQVSDARIKRRIEPTVVDALARLRALPVRRYIIIGEALTALQPRRPGQTPKPQPDATVPIGLVAQETRPIIPEMVGVATQPEGHDPALPDDLYHLDMAAAVPYLIRAIQQIAERVETLETKVRP